MTLSNTTRQVASGGPSGSYLHGSGSERRTTYPKYFRFPRKSAQFRGTAHTVTVWTSAPRP